MARRLFQTLVPDTGVDRTCKAGKPCRTRDEGPRMVVVPIARSATDWEHHPQPVFYNSSDSPGIGR